MKRTPLKRSQPKRYWELANEKVEGKPCRNCRSWQNVQRAHLVPRRFDKPMVGPRGGKLLLVHPDAIMELCGSSLQKIGCHERLDVHQLSVWHLMSEAEKEHAIEVLGEERARQRLERVAT